MSVGPFYCIYLRPLWRIVAKATDSDADFLGHPTFWRGLCKDVIAPHYGIRDKKTLGVLNDLCYAMPRGRCSQALSRRGKPMQEWTIYHGGDFPDAEAIEKAATAIYSAFNLVDRSQVKIRYDEHERMLSDDQQRMQQIIGPVPYFQRRLA